MIKKIVPFIPLGVMTGTLLYTCFVMATTIYILDLKHIIAMMLVFANIVFYLAKFSPRIGRRITLGIILLGVFNLLAFTPAIHSWYLAVGKQKLVILRLQPFSLLLLIIFIFCNWRLIGAKLEKYRK